MLWLGQVSTVRMAFAGRLVAVAALGAVLATALPAAAAAPRRAAASGGGGPVRGNPAFVSIGGQFVRGNANDDGYLDISDSIFLSSFLFRGGRPPACPDAADANDDGRIDSADSRYLLRYLFEGGPRPPQPFPSRGTDPTADALGCQPLPAGQLAVALLSRPVSQNVVAGARQFAAAALRLDAALSPTDVAVTSLTVRVRSNGVPPTAYANLTVLDGATPLAVRGGEIACDVSACRYRFPLASPLRVLRGTTKFVSLAGDVNPAFTAGTFTVFIQPRDIVAQDDTGKSVVPTLGRADGNPMTIVSSGALTIAALTTNHPAGLLPGNASGLEVGIFRLTAVREPIRVEKIYLSADSTRQIWPNGPQASAFNQVKAVHLYDGHIRLTPPGGVQPTSTDRLDRATTLIDLTANPIVVSVAGSKDITVKVDTNAVTRYPQASTGSPGQGFRFSIAASSDVTAQGAQSATRLNPEGITLTGATLNDWSVMASVPTVTVYANLATSEKIGQRETLPKLRAGSQKELYRFKVGADSAGDVYLFQVSVVINQHKATVTNPFIMLLDSGRQVAATTTSPLIQIITANELEQNYVFHFTSDGLAPANTTYAPHRLPAGSAQLFGLRGDVACWTDNGCGTANPSGSLGIGFLGDSGFPFLYPDNALTLYAGAGSNLNHFIWSDASIMGALGIASTTATISEQWFNGFRVRSAVSPIGRLQATTMDVQFNP